MKNVIKFTKLKKTLNHSTIVEIFNNNLPSTINNVP